MQQQVLSMLDQLKQTMLAQQKQRQQMEELLEKVVERFHHEYASRFEA